MHSLYTHSYLFIYIYIYRNPADKSAWIDTLNATISALKQKYKLTNERGRGMTTSTTSSGGGGSGPITSCERCSETFTKKNTKQMCLNWLVCYIFVYMDTYTFVF